MTKSPAPIRYSQRLQMGPIQTIAEAVTNIVKLMVDKPEDVSAEVVPLPPGMTLRYQVAPSDGGKLIGAQGPNLISSGAHVRHLRGASTILAHKRLLEDLAASTGQPASMHGLRFRLEHEYVRSKMPHLICIVAGQDVSAPLTVDSLLGCVLFFEYRIGSWNTGLFATGDSSGISTVIAPPGVRAQVAAFAASTALREGHLVLACFRNDSASFEGIAFPSKQRGVWAAQVRTVQDQLRLCPTYDLTLETLGKRTRTHLRYYRKQLKAETGCVFVADAAPFIPDSQLASLNSTSLKPISQGIFDLQFQTASERPGGFVCGLRAADGRWLSLAGGWRQGHASLLQWQMNADGFRHLSLSTAFRGFLIEHEVSLGTTELRFHGGTSHSMGHSFRQEYAVDLLLRRPGLLQVLFARVVPCFAQKYERLATRGNFLVDALRGSNLEWTPLSSATQRNEPLATWDGMEH